MAKTPTNAPTVRSITSLDDLQTRTFTGQIVIGSEVWEIECKELTRAEFYSFDDLVPDPAPAQLSGPSGTVYLTDDPGYRKARLAAGEERLLWRVAEMMQIPDKTHAEKLEALRKAPMGFVNGLSKLLSETQFVEEVRIEALSRSFRREKASNGTHPENDGVDAELLVLAAEV